MKNKKKSNIDPIAKVRKDKNFSLYAKEVTELIKIKIAMYKARKKKGWSQTMLAKEMYTTEEIIDNIENNDGLNL